MRKSYDTDLTDQEWAIIEPLLPKSRTKPCQCSKREMLNAIFYLLKSECRWRMIPHDFPPQPTVAYPYDTWKKKDVFKRINLGLNKLYRAEVGKEPTPSTLMVDGQTVATSSAGGLRRKQKEKRTKTQRAWGYFGMGMAYWG